MPGLATATTPETVREITLKPTVRRKLLTELKVYEQLKGQMEVLQLALDKHKGIIGAIREETGEQSIALEGFKITLVAPIRKKFNGAKFVQLGGDIAIYNAAHDSVPGRAYDRITLPGDKNGEE